MTIFCLILYLPNIPTSGRQGPKLAPNLRTLKTTFFSCFPSNQSPKIINFLDPQKGPK